MFAFEQLFKTFTLSQVFCIIFYKVKHDRNTQKEPHKKISDRVTVTISRRGIYLKTTISI